MYIMPKYAFAQGDETMDALLVPVFQDKNVETLVKDLNAIHGGLFEAVKDLKDFEGKPKQMSLLYTNDAATPRVFLIGLGKEKTLSVRLWKQVIGSGVIGAQGKKGTKVGIVLPQRVVKKFGGKKLGQETAIAAETAQYAFDRHKSKKDSHVKSLKNVWFSGDLTSAQRSRVLDGVKRGSVIVESVNVVRELGNTPPTVMTPQYLSKEARALAKQFAKITTTVHGRADMKKFGMGCLLGVSSGSQHEPQFIVLNYKGGKVKEDPTVLIGKGITFDSGGLSLKPENYMKDMKFDMLGAATVLATVKAAAGLKLKKNIIGLIPTCENMPGGESYRPDDILTAMNGRSVLIENTDAEGRLILSDALSYAGIKLKPKEVIDFATLTGACMVAVGTERSGLFSPEQKMIDKLSKAGEEVGEQLWHLPLGEEYSEAMKCEIADIKNLGGVGGSRGYGSASTAAAFLQFFTLDPKTDEPLYKWAHIDLSSSYYGGKGKPWIRGGANGFGVQMMIEYLS